MALFTIGLPGTSATPKKVTTARKNTKNNTRKSTKNKVIHLSKFLSVIKKPELCATNKWFTKGKDGKYHGACPIAKAATKRGFKYNGGAKAAVAISKKFNIPLNEINDFMQEWDSRIENLKQDNRNTTAFTKKALSRVKLTTHEIRVAFKESLRAAMNQARTVTERPLAF